MENSVQINFHSTHHFLQLNLQMGTQMALQMGTPENKKTLHRCKVLIIKWRISESNRWPFDCQDWCSTFHHFISFCISYHYTNSNPDFFTPFFPVFPFLWQIFWQIFRKWKLDERNVIWTYSMIFHSWWNSWFAVCKCWQKLHSFANFGLWVSLCDLHMCAMYVGFPNCPEGQKQAGKN